jgi:hypothetical protein
MIYLFPRVISLLALLLLPCVVVASGSEQPPYRPLVSPLAKDRNTSLYTISIKKSAPLVVDLAGSLVWSTCPSTHGTVPCHSDTCRAANQQRRPRCRYVDAGGFGANREPGGGCACAGRPFNPVTGECSVGDLTGMAMSANATDGRNTLHPVEFTTAGSCAPDRLLRSLPAGATGVAGFSRRPLSDIFPRRGACPRPPPRRPIARISSARSSAASRYSITMGPGSIQLRRLDLELEGLADAC